MNENKDCSPAKKRKANDGRATTDCEHDVNTCNNNDGGGFLSSWFGYFSGRRYGGASSGPPGYDTSIHQSLSQMNATMMRMEEKLASVNSLERRCEELERKCSSLENVLESTSKATEKHIDKRYFDLDRKCDSLAIRLEDKVDNVHKQEEVKALKRHEFSKMLIKNLSWEYSAALPSVDDMINNYYTDEEATYLAETAEELKDMTTSMRRGEFPCKLRDMINVEMSDSEPPFSYEVNTELLPHWNEFAAALKQFTPAIKLSPDNCESSFTFYSVQLNPNAMLLIKDALMGMPFKMFDFTNNNNGDGARGGMSVDAILDVVESNKHLRKLVIWKYQIGSQHIERLRSAVRNHHLVELDLDNSFEPGIGDEMLASLLTIDDLKLEKLGMSSNNVTSVGSAVVADFLATNPRLKELDLSENNLTDSDAELIANALRSNTTLRVLGLFHNNTTDAGDEALHLVIYECSSLNAVADSNHICSVKVGWAPLDYSNLHKDEPMNRGMKIYHLLSCRNKTMSNAKHFGDIDVKILPDMLGAVQKYQINASVYKAKHYIRHDPQVNPLSIVYEVMRRWDKVFPLYKTLGKSV